MTAIDDAADRIRATAQLPLPQAERAQRIAAAIHKATGHRWVGIYAVAAGEVTNLAWSGPAPPAHPSFPADAGLTAAAIQAHAPVVFGDVGGDPRYLQALPTTASEMIIPIVVDGAVVGTLDVESDLPDAFGTADRVALARIAAALAGLYGPPT
jgi:L-methionine (R)-S-oxide reductase